MLVDRRMQEPPSGASSAATGAFNAATRTRTATAAAAAAVASGTGSRRFKQYLRLPVKTLNPVSPPVSYTHLTLPTIYPV